MRQIMQSVFCCEKLTVKENLRFMHIEERQKNR